MTCLTTIKCFLIKNSTCRLQSKYWRKKSALRLKFVLGQPSVNTPQWWNVQWSTLGFYGIFNVTGLSLLFNVGCQVDNVKLWTLSDYYFAPWDVISYALHLTLSQLCCRWNECHYATVAELPDCQMSAASNVTAEWVSGDELKWLEVASLLYHHQR